MRIELLATPDCPHAERAEAILRAALTETAASRRSNASSLTTSTTPPGWASTAHRRSGSTGAMSSRPRPANQSDSPAGCTSSPTDGATGSCQPRRSVPRTSACAKRRRPPTERACGRARFPPSCRAPSSCGRHGDDSWAVSRPPFRSRERWSAASWPATGWRTP